MSIIPQATFSTYRTADGEVIYSGQIVLSFSEMIPRELDNSDDAVYSHLHRKILSQLFREIYGPLEDVINARLIPAVTAKEPYLLSEARAAMEEVLYDWKETPAKATGVTLTSTEQPEEDLKCSPEV